MDYDPEAVVCEQHCSILAPPTESAEKPFVLKHNDVFGVFDRFGDIECGDRHDAGVYYKGSRCLSRFRLRVGTARPLLLSSTVRRDNVVLAVDLTNPDLRDEQGLIAPHGALHIYRAQFLWNDALHLRIHVRNFARFAIEVCLHIDVGADFADVFEIRGTERARTGLRLPPRAAEDAMVLEYEGLDSVCRRTVIRSPTNPEAIGSGNLSLIANLEPGASCHYEANAAFEIDERRIYPVGYEASLAKATEAFNDRASECSVTTSNEQFNVWLRQSLYDLRMLTTRTQGSAFPYAGIPWFSTPFGRDAIITALECLWMNPALSRGVLRYLTSTQARHTSPEQDAEPGKILHEARDGEMAALGEIPFGRYYGSVDATPLYLLLAAEYFQRTDDGTFLGEIWDGIERALAWVDGDGDPDHDGFVEYCRQSKDGLVQQGWKDSRDSIFHRDGSLAKGSIALCEVQGYIYAAKRGLSDLALRLGDVTKAETLKKESDLLRDRFNAAFWSATLNTYVIALDGAKQQCEVYSSNAGHSLFCGIASEDRARAVANHLMGPRFHSGWGIRTIAEGESRYNPMSYHNGSVWPHDNALIAEGFSRYGLTDQSAKVLTGLFQAASSMEASRLPELFCGFKKRAGKSPTWYPTACAPQAWSAASVAGLLQASLGISADAVHKQVVLRYPVLPDFLEWVKVRNLAVGDARLDLRLFRSGKGVAVAVERRTGEADVMVLQ